MKKTHISALISALLISGVASSVGAETTVQAVVQSQSVTTAVTVSGTVWYAQAQISLANVTGQTLELAQMELEISVPASVEVSNAWGSWPAVYTIESQASSDARKHYLIKQTADTATLAAGASTPLILDLNPGGNLLITPSDVVVEKVTIKNDPAYSGEIRISAPSAPDDSLSAAQVLITGDSYSETRDIAWGGEITLSNLPDGTYTVTPQEIRSQIGYAQGGSSSEVVVQSGESTPVVAVDYQPFIYFAAIELHMPAISGTEQKMSSLISVYPAGSEQLLKQQSAVFGETLAINELEDGQRYDLRYSDVVLNNLRHTLTPGLDLAVSHQSALSVTPELNSQAVDDSQFTQVTPVISGLPSSVSSIKLTLSSEQASYAFELATDASELPYRIQPGEYQVKADTIALNGENYVLDISNPVTVTAGGPLSLPLPFHNGVKLAVKGFPDFVANGTVTSDSESVTTQIGATKVDAIFKYAGFSGSGDPGVILAKSELPLHRTLKNAQSASAIAGKHILPVMVVYTANASGGASFVDLEENDYLYKHYATFITQATAAQEYAQGDGHSPMSFVLNPDFLGELQKNPSHVDELNQSGRVQVNAQLANALAYMQTTYNFVPSDPVPTFDDTLKGYIQSLNYIMKAFAPDVSFGWQINLWAVGSANWIHATEDQSSLQGTKVGQFVNSLGVYDSQYKPDYIVFDKYERDGFGSEAIANYAYNATSWQRYLDYVKVISDAVDAPAMIWQIPGGHMPTEEEGVSMLESNHQASGGSFFMGDSRIASNLDAVYTGLLDKALSAAIYNGASNVRELLQKDNGYNWSYRRMQDLPEHNVFALLWGGGSTTAVVSIGSNGSDSGWLSNKVSDYANNPTCLYGSDCDGSIWGGNGNNTPDPDPENNAPVITLAPQFSAESRAQVTITASAVDPEGSTVSYSWQVPAEVSVVSGVNSNTLVVTAPAVVSETSYTLTLTASDGQKSATSSTQLTVKAPSGGEEGTCTGIAAYVDGAQYKPGDEVQYLNEHYQAERWTDVGKTPDQPYTGWNHVGSCN